MRQEKHYDWIFEEEQRLPENWRWIFVVFILAISILPWLITGFDHRPDEPGILKALFFVLPLDLIVILAFYYTNLQLKVSAQELSVRLFPFQWKSRIIRMEDVQEAGIRRSPWMQYGLHWIPGFGWAYRIRGVYGIQLRMKNGRRIFVSSGNLSAFTTAMEKALGRKIAGMSPGIANTDRF